MDLHHDLVDIIQVLQWVSAESDPFPSLDIRFYRNVFSFQAIFVNDALKGFELVNFVLGNCPDARVGINIQVVVRLALRLTS